MSSSRVPFTHSAPYQKFFLGFFRAWLRLVATGFAATAVALRLLGTGATVLSGAVAFTVRMMRYKPRLVGPGPKAQGPFTVGPLPRTAPLEPHTAHEDAQA
jgi:hypothetical protein